MKLNAVRVDRNKVEQGVWLEAGMFDARLAGIKIKIRGFGNTDDQRIQDEERENLPAHLKVPGATIPTSFHTKLMNRRLAEAIVTDWDGVTGDDDQPMPFSREAVLRYVEDDEYKILRDIFITAGSQVASGNTRGIEADLGNSPLASAGRSSGANTSSGSPTSRKKR